MTLVMVQMKTGFRIPVVVILLQRLKLQLSQVGLGLTLVHGARVALGFGSC